MNIYKKTTKLCVMGMLSALSIVLVFALRLPLLPDAPYLEYDPADIPILVTAYFYGPLPALAVTFVVCVIQGLTVSASSGFIGILMHFFATGFMCAVVGLVNKKGEFNQRTFIAAILGCLTMILVMIPLNLIFTPLYTGMPTKAIAELLLPVFIPFNAIKSGINTIISIVIYASVLPLLNMRTKKSKSV